MLNQNKFIVSHAPFWHDESKVSIRYYNILIATLPAVLFGLIQYGMPAVAVVSLSVSSAIFWELLINRLTKRPITVADGNAALIGMLLAMLLPASSPWWLVITGTFVAIVIGKHIYGGIGANPFNPALVAVAILTLSWKGFLNFDQALLNYDLNFNMVYPLVAVKNFGSAAAASFNPGDLLLGRQSGGLGATFGLGLFLGGFYLILRGFIRWEISLSFLAGIVITAFFFRLIDSGRFAGPLFHLLTGNTILGAFFLATEDSSSPANFIPMLIYGVAAGVMIMLIRNIGGHADGVVYAILLMNLANPLLDKIRPKALGKVNSHA